MKNLLLFFLLLLANFSVAGKIDTPPWEQLGITKESWDSGVVVPRNLWLHDNQSEEMNRALLHNPLAHITPEERQQTAKYLKTSGENEAEFAELVKEEVAARYISNKYKIPVDTVKSNWKNFSQREFGREMSGGEVYTALREIRQRELKEEKRKEIEEVIFALTFAFALSFFMLWLLTVLIKKSDKISEFFIKVKDGFGNLSDRQKICFGMSLATVVILFMAISSRWSNGFYIFLRWVVCLALVGKLLEKFPAWFKFILIVGAIIYNPIAPIHLGDRDDWLLINWITLPIIVSAEVITLKKTSKNGTPKNS